MTVEEYLLKRILELEKENAELKEHTKMLAQYLALSKREEAKQVGKSLSDFIKGIFEDQSNDGKET